MTDKTNPTHARVADWANKYPDFYQNGHVAMQVDEPDESPYVAVLQDMLLGAALALAAVGVCIGLALYFK